MKNLFLISALALSTSAFAASPKCSKYAGASVVKFAVSEGIVADRSEFDSNWGEAGVEIILKNGWQEEIHSFGDGSGFIIATFHALSSKCILKKIETAQDDQDWD